MALNSEVDIGVWSSQDRDNTQAQVKEYSQAYKDEIGHGKVFSSGGKSVQLSNFDVFISTPFWFINQLQNKPTEFALSSFHLIIFDDAHHRSGNHPYMNFAKKLNSVFNDQMLRSSNSTMGY
jgi:ERCC4-related helicase